jgi:hypothetical protein
MSFFVLLGALKNEWKKIPLFFLWEKKRCRDNEKNIMWWFFFVKKEEKKKKEKSGDSFRDIVRKKIVNDESYVLSSEYYKSVVKFLPVVFEESVSEADMSNDSW